MKERWAGLWRREELGRWFWGSEEERSEMRRRREDD
jgi:hypothetical protein